MNTERSSLGAEPFRVKGPWPGKPDPWLSPTELEAMVERILAPAKEALRG